MHTPLQQLRHSASDSNLLRLLARSDAGAPASAAGLRRKESKEGLGRLAKRLERLEEVQAAALAKSAAESRLHTALGRGQAAATALLAVAVLVLGLLARGGPGDGPAAALGRLAPDWVAGDGAWDIHDARTSPVCSSAYAPMRDIRLESFSGTWYKVAWLPNADTDAAQFSINSNSCLFANFTLVERTLLATFEASAYKPADGPLRRFDGAAPVDPAEPGRLHFRVGGDSIPVWILATNYRDFAIVYLCAPSLSPKAQQAYILSRQPRMNPLALGRAIEEAKTLGLLWRQFEVKQQLDQCA